MATYRPKEDTIAARAIEIIDKALQNEACGAWVSNVALCNALGVKTNTTRNSLAKCVDVGLVEKSFDRAGFMQWRLGFIKPRPKAKKAAAPQGPVFSIPNWPPGFVSQFETVVVPTYETRRK